MRIKIKTKFYIMYMENDILLCIKKSIKNVRKQDNFEL